jgi:hypothetical protein
MDAKPHADFSGAKRDYNQTTANQNRNFIRTSQDNEMVRY